tara:strand:+ start:110 stop:364 length:255 start_codon:yes stop_codon:yes gene_type:complete
VINIQKNIKCKNIKCKNIKKYKILIKYLIKMINSRELKDIFGNTGINYDHNLFNKIDNIMKYYIIIIYIFLFSFIILEIYKIKL